MIETRNNILNQKLFKPNFNRILIYGSTVFGKNIHKLFSNLMAKRLIIKIKVLNQPFDHKAT